MYRNRLGEPTIPAGHSLHGYGADLPGWKEGREGRTQHPEYYNVIDGQPGNWINLANPEVATIFAKRAVELFRQGPRKGAPGGKVALGIFSISPDDGFLRDERPEVVAMNSPEFDPDPGDALVLRRLVRVPHPGLRRSRAAGARLGFPLRLAGVHELHSAAEESQAPSADHSGDRPDHLQPLHEHGHLRARRLRKPWSRSSGDGRRFRRASACTCTTSTCPTWRCRTRGGCTGRRTFPSSTPGASGT